MLSMWTSLAGALWREGESWCEGKCGSDGAIGVDGGGVCFEEEVERKQEEWWQSPGGCPLCGVGRMTGSEDASRRKRRRERVDVGGRIVDMGKCGAGVDIVVRAGGSVGWRLED